MKFRDFVMLADIDVPVYVNEATKNGKFSSDIRVYSSSVTNFLQVGYYKKYLDYNVSYFTLEDGHFDVYVYRNKKGKK